MQPDEPGLLCKYNIHPTQSPMSYHVCYCLLGYLISKLEYDMDALPHVESKFIHILVIINVWSRLYNTTQNPVTHKTYLDVINHLLGDDAAFEGNLNECLL
jgi:hypothetical protein